MSDDHSAAALERLRPHPIHLRPCRIQILMVIDGIGSFDTEIFGLSSLLEALSAPPGPWVRFDVTTAHRTGHASASPPEPFKFDAVDLTQYDQIWLFGVDSVGPELTETELRALAEFMDGGGGVFATGDHEDLGVKMCGRVPRVRSMRKWHWPSPGPNGEPIAPKVDGPDRRDTLSRGNDLVVQFDDQSDDMPQCITPKTYATWHWNPYWHRERPHPLLCGPQGVIRVLPDHAHEGECYVPADLTATFTFDGYTTTEYPAGLAPEVIAWSRNGCRMPSDVKGVLNPATFGAIGAYDGHRADVGRVVVDATWHHFFNINLVGIAGNADPIKRKGFTATPSGQEAYEDIKSYFRNIAVWLARESTQRRMWWCAVWWARWHHRVAMDLRPHYLASVDRLDLAELLRIGSEARDALGRVASQCTIQDWAAKHLIRPVFPRVWEELADVLDPWRPRPPLPDVFPMPDPRIVASLHGELLVDACLGAVMHAVAARFPQAGEESRLLAEDTDFGDVVGDHVRQAVRLLARHSADEGEVLRRVATAAGDREREE